MLAYEERIPTNKVRAKSSFAKLVKQGQFVFGVSLYRDYKACSMILGLILFLSLVVLCWKCTPLEADFANKLFPLLILWS